MSTVPPPMKGQTGVPTAYDKFGVDRSVVGGITVLRMRGTLDHAFIGRKIADLVSTKKVVIQMRNVRRFASWGMSEWMEFLRINHERDIYIVESSTYAMSQLNVVTGLLGHAKLVSFYAAYRCGGCAEAQENLFVVPRDRSSIRDLPGSYQSCRTCGGHARLEDYPAAFFDTIAERPPFDIDDEVLAYFRTKLDYDLKPDLSRFRAHRRARKNHTYLRLSGGLGTLPAPALINAAQGVTVVDLQRVLFDRGELAGWRAFVDGARAKADVSSLQLLDCPLDFIDAAIKADDLRDKVKVRTFTVAYECARCQTSTPMVVDVADNLEELVVGMVPKVRCAACQGLLVARMTPELVTLLRALPARDRDPGLEAFLGKARTEPQDKLEDGLTVATAKAVEQPAGGGRAMYLALSLTMLVIAGLGTVAFFLWKNRGDNNGQLAQNGGTVIPPPPAVDALVRPDRPDWVITDAPSTAVCHDLINRLVCVGESSYRDNRDDAVTDATDAALDELVNTVALKITDRNFKTAVLPAYAELRSKALSALQNADLDRKDKATAAADAAVAKGRRQVAAALQASGGAAVPAQRSDWYWEEYAKRDGKGNEFLVWVRYDISNDAIKALIDRYSTPTQVLGSTTITAFPGLGWKLGEFGGGVLVLRAARALAGAGVQADDLIVGLGDQKVFDAATLARRVEEASGKLALTVKSKDAAPRVVEVKK